TTTMWRARPLPNRRRRSTLPSVAGHRFGPTGIRRVVAVVARALLAEGARRTVHLGRLAGVRTRRLIEGAVVAADAVVLAGLPGSGDRLAHAVGARLAERSALTLAVVARALVVLRARATIGDLRDEERA